MPNASSPTDSPGSPAAVRPSPAPAPPATTVANSARPPIHAQTRATLEGQFHAWGLPGWRVGQLLDWLYAKRAASWDAMSNLPRDLRQRLAETYAFALPEVVQRQGAEDATQKFLWRLADGALIESVLIPANPALYGERADRHTLCVSTQVGCAYGCKFCASGLDGWKRNLGPDEIIGQVLGVEIFQRQRLANQLRPAATPATDSAEPLGKPEAEAALSTAKPAAPAIPGSGRWIDNLVIMGMGEPLANYEHLLAALRVINAPWGLGIGARKITISTSGLVPQIRRLAHEPEQFRLAISLHGATDAVRGQIMPVNRKYPLAELTNACLEYVEHKGKMITLEYILLAGVNDGLDQVAPLGALARRLHAKVNLIPYNHVDGLSWTRPSDDRCETFATRLERLDVPVTLRLEKGHDIDAACGQLRLKTEREQERTASGRG